MNRRTILAGAGALTLGAGMSAPGRAAAPSGYRIKTYICNVADHCDAERFARLATGQEFALAIDHARTFDPGSVAVRTQEGPVGYLPRSIGHVIAAQIEGGGTLKAIATTIRRGPRPAIDIELRTI